RMEELLECSDLNAFGESRLPLYVRAHCNCLNQGDTAYRVTSRGRYGRLDTNWGRTTHLNVISHLYPADREDQKREEEQVAVKESRSSIRSSWSRRRRSIRIRSSISSSSSS